VCSARVPPTTLSDANKPARTTDAVPCNHPYFDISRTIKGNRLEDDEDPIKDQPCNSKKRKLSWFSSIYLDIIIENKMTLAILFKQSKSIMIGKVLEL
jgi:hypothetical protein